MKISLVSEATESGAEPIMMTVTRSLRRMLELPAMAYGRAPATVQGRAGRERRI
jgi:hypothetical protein